MYKNLRIAVLTQEDSFTIPKNIKLLSNINTLKITAVVKINSAGSLSNRKLTFIRGFGFIQTGKLALLSFFNKVLDILDMIFLFKLGFLKSLKAASVFCDSEYKEIRDPNCKSFINWLAKLNVDLVVSFSAPCVFKNELLNLPKLGCINLHCSLLPKFAGLLPSFWTLYHETETLGATVHKMDDKIDNGAILGQVRIPRPSKLSMFNVIKETKSAGGNLMVSVIKNIIDGNVKEQANHAEEESNFSWPKSCQIKEFRRNGGRLI